MPQKKVMPLYKRIKGDIANQITSLNLSPGDQLPTRDDLAARYQTTRATVDRAMQELVTDGLLIGGSGRRTSVAEASVPSPQSLLVVWNDVRQHLDMGDYFFGPLAQGIHRACADYKIQAHFRDSQPGSYASDLKETGAQGILALRSDYRDTPILQKLWEDGIPIVALPGALQSKTVPSIASDNIGGVEQAIDHLVALGHQDIAFLSLAVDVPDHWERVQGFLAAMAKHRLPINPHRLHLTHEMSKSEYGAEIRRWLDSAPLPGAIFAADSVMGLGALIQLNAMGYQVPRDVSMVQFDDSPVSMQFPPAMTVVQQDIGKLGYSGVERLLQLIRGEDAPTVIRLPTTLIVRDSTSMSVSVESRLKS